MQAPKSPTQPVVAVIDEAGQRYSVREARPAGRSYGKVFHTTFTIEVAKLATATKHATTLRVFLILPAHLSYEVFKVLPGERLASALDVDQTSISRAMRELLALGAVERSGKGPRTMWRLTPDFGWRGDVAGYHAAQRKRGKAAPPGPPPHAIKSRISEIGESPSAAVEEANKPAPPPRQRSLRLLSPITEATR